MRQMLLFFLVLGFVSMINAQELRTRDSLYSILHSTMDDSIKKQVLSKLYLYYYPINRDSSNHFGTSLIELAKETNDSKLLYDVYSYLGNQNRTAGNYFAAMDWIYRMLDLAQEKKDTITVATALNAIGNLFKDQGLYRKAIAQYSECKKLSEGKNDSAYKRTLVFACMNMGFAYEQLKQIDSALVFEQTAYSLALQINDEESLQYILYCLGNIHSQLKNHQLAVDYFNMGLSHGGEENRYSCMIYNALAKYHIRTENGDAVMFGRKALSASKAIGNVKLMAESSKMLSDVFKARKNKDSALYYQDLYISLNDSLNNRERIAQFENRMFKEVLNQQEKADAIDRAREKRRYNIQLVFLTLGILVILMLFLLISRSIIVSHKMVEFLGIVVLLVLFEFINLVLHPLLAQLTNEQPVVMLAAMVAIAALIVPIHHRLEKWTSNILVEKNKAIRLANAKKVIRELEKNE